MTDDSNNYDANKFDDKEYIEATLKKYGLTNKIHSKLVKDMYGAPSWKKENFPALCDVMSCLLGTRPDLIQEEKNDEEYLYE